MEKIWRRKPDLNDRESKETRRPATLKKSPSIASFSSGGAGKKLVEGGSGAAKDTKGMPKAAGGPGMRGDASRSGTPSSALNGSGRTGEGGSDQAPKLDVDIRNSLMLPDLSQRFSVLLPKLYATPEASVREMLASQRARGLGPSLTVDEEEMLLAEMRDESAIRRAGGDFWDAPADRMPATSTVTSPYSANGFAFPSPSGSGSSRRHVSPSASSPSLLQLGGASPTKSPGSTFAAKQTPPTSNSFSSFRTFGTSPESPPATSSTSLGVRSYGFSGLSGMRDESYMRKAKRSVSQKEAGEASSGLRISPTRANAHHDRTFSHSALDLHSTASSHSTVSASAGAEPGARGPSSTAPLNLYKARSNSPSARSALDLPLPPQLPPPTSAPPPAPYPSSSQGMEGRPPRSRTSLTVPFSPGQAKRISKALQEVEAELQRMHRTFSKENLLDEATDEGTANGQEVIVIGAPPGADALRLRQRVRTTPTHSRTSSTSDGSEALPLQIAPTNRNLAGLPPASGSTTAPAPAGDSSPGSKLRASPRSHNLLAHVEPDRRPPPPGPVFRPSGARAGHQPRVSVDSTGTPRPVLTPSRTTPARHVPTPSSGSSASSFSSPAYVPGQPRPVGSLLRSEGPGSAPSRTRTPSGFNPVYVPPHEALGSPAIIGEGEARPPSGPQPRIHARSSSLSKQVYAPEHSHSPSMPDSPLLGSPITSSASSPPTESGSARLTRSTLSPAPSAQPATIHEESDEGDEDGPDVSDEEDPVEADQTVFAPLSARNNDLRIQSVHERRSVTESLSPSSPRQPDDPLDTLDIDHFVNQSRRASVQDTASGRSDAAPLAYGRGAGVPSTPKRVSSASSVSSYDEPLSPTDKIRWNEAYEVSPIQGRGSDLPSSEGDHGDVLRKLSGLSKADLADMQQRLVEKARAEREALRGTEGSPVVSFSPPMPSSGSAFRHGSVSQRAMSPTLWREVDTPATPPVEVTAPTPAETAGAPFLAETHTTPVLSAPASLAGLFTPPLSAPVSASTPPSAQSTYTATLPSMAPTSATSLDERDGPFTPLTDADTLSRNASISKQGRPKPEDDPEVRKAFEAKIADAYAQLNRTPTSNQPRSLERKYTKRNAPLQISSPRLLSSSAVLPPSPGTPGSGQASAPGGVAKHARKASDKTGTGGSGNGNKMGQRWRKLMGLKGTSLSAEEMAHSMASPSTASLTPPPAWSGSGSGVGAVQKLEEPIDLPGLSQLNGNASNREQTTHSQAHASQVSLNDFKFPLRAPLESVTSSGTVPTTAGQPDRALVIANITPSSSPAPGHVHAPSLSDDAAVANFLLAGRALGLGEAQLHEMLRQKQGAALGASDRVTQVQSQQRAPSASAAGGGGGRASPAGSGVAMVRNPSGNGTSKEERSGGGGVKGLLRSLSRRKQSTSSTVPSSDRDPMPLTSRTGGAPEVRRVVVRRTLLLPMDAVLPVPSTPVVQQSSPEPTAVGGMGRKLSVKRKPINLTPEDASLVASSPISDASRLRKISAGTSSVGSEQQQQQSGPPNTLNKGLGFLQPHAASQDMRASPSKESTGSTGGSLYDLYGDDGDEAEVLASPTKAAKSAVRASQAVEIREYADGEIVFAVVDALHDPDDPDSTPNLTHSRKSSYASSHQYSNGDAQDVFLPSPSASGSPAVGLQLRHRDRHQQDGLRPLTKVYKTSAQDIDALFDELAKDFDATKGRIDFRTSVASRYDDGSVTDFEPGRSPALYDPSLATTSPPISPRSPRTPAMINEAFEDAPSPLPVSHFSRPELPAPIHSVPASQYVPTGGLSPRRQMMARQGFAAHRQDLGKTGGAADGVGIDSSREAGDGGPVLSTRTVEDRLQALLDRIKADPA